MMRDYQRPGDFRIERKDEYYCEKHNFRTTDPRSAMRHIQGDMVDRTMELVAKVIKIHLRLDP